MIEINVTFVINVQYIMVWQMYTKPHNIHCNVLNSDSYCNKSFLTFKIKRSLFQSFLTVCLKLGICTIEFCKIIPQYDYVITMWFIVQLEPSPN